MAWYDFLNPVNWFKGIGDHLNASWNAIEGYGYKTDDEIRRENEARRNEDINRLLSFNNDFKTLFDNGASAEDLIKYAMDNPDWAQANQGAIESFVNMANQRDLDSRNLYGENIAKMKEAGINPLVGLGNVGSLGSYEGAGAVDLGQHVQQAKEGSDFNGNLANIKNILMILLALGRL